MENIKVFFIDHVFSKCKNLQKINTINIFYSVNPKGNFSIRYQLYYLDFEIWKQIYREHIDQVDNHNLYVDNIKTTVDEIKESEYYYIELISSGANLYRNINLIPFIKMGDWNNMNEQILLNSWEE